ncbi:MAG: rhodanese-like domain-containing protein [Bdellovibrionota bacterium]
METENKKLLIPGNPQDAKEFFMQKIRFTTGPIEVRDFQKRGETFNFIDVRTAEDYREAHPLGAVNLPREKWDTFEGLSKDKVNILFCYSQVCHLAAKAAVKFSARGFPVMEMEGGCESWKSHMLPMVSSETAENKKSA